MGCSAATRFAPWKRQRGDNRDESLSVGEWHGEIKDRLGPVDVVFARLRTRVRLPAPPLNQERPPVGSRLEGVSLWSATRSWRRVVTSPRAPARQLDSFVEA